MSQRKVRKWEGGTYRHGYGHRHKGTCRLDFEIFYLVMNTNTYWHFFNEDTDMDTDMGEM